MSAQPRAIIEDRRIRFDSYDFFGYFLPGILATGASLLGFLGLTEQSFGKFVQQYVAGPTQLFIAFGIAFLFCSYIFGHVISSISAIILDKFYVQNVKGYPFDRIIFNIEKKENERTRFFRIIVFFFYIIPLCFSIETILNYDRYLSSSIFLLLIISILIYTLYKIRFNFLKKPLFILQISLCFPILFFERQIRNYLNLDRPISKESQDIFKYKFKKCFSMEASENSGSDVFWLSYWKCLENVSSSGAIYNWLLLYSFLRNMSICMLITISVCTFYSGLYFNRNVSMIFVICIWLISVFFATRFYYIYYNYYSKSIARTFIVATCKPV